MTAAALLAECNRRRLLVWTEGNQLRFRGPPGAPDDALKSQLVRLKPDLLRALAPPDDWRDEIAEEVARLKRRAANAGVDAPTRDRLSALAGEAPADFGCVAAWGDRLSGLEHELRERGRLPPDPGAGP